MSPYINTFSWLKKTSNINTPQRFAINTETCDQHFPTTNSFSLLCKCHQNSRDMKRVILNIFYVNKIRITVSSHNTMSESPYVWHCWKSILGCFNSISGCFNSISLYFYLTITDLQPNLLFKTYKFKKTEFLSDLVQDATVKNRFTFIRRVNVQRGRVLEHGGHFLTK